VRVLAAQVRRALWPVERHRATAAARARAKAVVRAPVDCRSGALMVPERCEPPAARVRPASWLAEAGWAAGGWVWVGPARSPFR
jgi:hypothetical protein